MTTEESGTHEHRTAHSIGACSGRVGRAPGLRSAGEVSRGRAPGRCGSERRCAADARRLRTLGRRTCRWRLRSHQAHWRARPRRHHRRGARAHQPVPPAGARERRPAPAVRRHPPAGNVGPAPGGHGLPEHPARHRGGDGRDGQRQVHDARGAHRRHQPHAR